MHRSVHYGALTLVAGAAVFVAANLLLPLGYAGFSITSSSIGDLGNAGHTSWAGLFDGAAIIFGLFGLIGGFLVWTAFPLKVSRTIGLLLIELSFVSAVGLGAVPQGSTYAIASFPSIAVDVLLVASGLGLLLLSLAMLRDTRWSGYRFYTLVSGAITLVALVLTWASVWGPLGPGGLERIALAPFLLWLLVAGTHLARIPTYTPPGLSVTA